MRHPSWNINGHTRLAGVVGWPIEHTLSPAMHNAAFRYYGLPVAYLPLGVPPAGLNAFCRGWRQVNPLGFNVTVPHKETILKHLDGLAPSAAAMGAANTVVCRHGRWIGHNTDGYGFLASLAGVFSPRGQQAVLLGGGGAGRAVAFSLARAGVARLTLVEPDAGRCRRLLQALRRRGFKAVAAANPGSTDLREALSRCQLLVQASPLGLRPQDPLPLPEAWLPRGICVYDLVYGRSLTPFLRLARRRRNRIIPGWKMLLWQGAEAFRLWTGRKPPVAVMQAALVEAGGLKEV
jgi:shikimate dehydrogenase